MTTRDYFEKISQDLEKTHMRNDRPICIGRSSEAMNSGKKNEVLVETMLHTNKKWNCTEVNENVVKKL